MTTCEPQRYLLTVEYVGTAYKGSQLQPGLNTVQVRSRGMRTRVVGRMLLCATTVTPVVGGSGSCTSQADATRIAAAGHIRGADRRGSARSWHDCSRRPASAG